MQTLHLTKCFGISLVLHLATVSCMIAVAARNAERTPKTIMVVLDNPDSPELPAHVLTPAPVHSVVRLKAQVKPTIPARTKPVEMRSGQVQLSRQPLLVRDNVTSTPSEKIQIQEIPTESPEHTTTVPDQSATVNSAQRPVQHFVPPEEDRPTPGKAQHRYLKEHFTYIRELITKHLVYPPIARKMNWSGKVVVAFTIAENGNVQDVRVAATSGFQILDKSAVETVRSVAPFPKPPVRAEIVVPINFKIMH